MQIRSIDVERDRKTIVSFFKSLYREAVGEELANFDESEYINRLRTNSARFPDGYVLVLMEGQPVGHMELQVKSYKERPVGYVSTIYLQPDFRGRGVSQEMLTYAEDFFRKQSVDEYHLKVDVRNIRAQRFYEKAGLSILKNEPNSLGDPCYRMGKRL